MEALRENLAKLSTTIPELPHSAGSSTSNLALVAPNLLAVLNAPPKSCPSLVLLSLIPPRRAPDSTRKHTLKLPDAAHPPTAIIPAEGMLAVSGPSSVCVIDGLSSLNVTTPPTPRPVASALFASRPGLRVLHVAWSPAAPGFLMMLTSDGSLRLYDVLAPGALDVERWRMRVVTAASRPISFAFGRDPGWDSLSVYVLGEDGKVYVAAPVAPIGTRIQRDIWVRMLKESIATIDKETTKPTKGNSASSSAQDAPTPGDPFAPRPIPSRSQSNTPRRLLDFSSAQEVGTKEDNVGSGTEGEPWALRQAQMQRRFLEHVFTATPGGDMVATREFKPAPLLFQGPLYTEHDDLDDEEDYDLGDVPESCKFRNLTILHCGSGRPPVLLRTTTAGEVSVLIALEKVEAQWFLNSDSFASAGDELLEASEEYSECARAVAPLLLCFEHFSFGNDAVTLFPLGGKTDADVLYAVTSNAVFSMRLSFVSAISDAATLDSTPKSTISSLLSVSTPGVGTADALPRNFLLGLTPWYAKGHGPVALVVSADGVLHATDPLRWVTDFDKSCPSSLLGSGPSADSIWNSERPMTGSGAYACPDSGKEMKQIFHAIEALKKEYSGLVTEGTLGKAGELTSYAHTIKYLDKRLEVLTGSEARGPGIGDSLKNLADVLNQWCEELRSRAESDCEAVTSLQGVLTDIEKSGYSLQRKVGQVEAANIALTRRIEAVTKAIQKGSSQLSTGERERYNRLKDRKRRLAALKVRMEEVRSAIEARKKQPQKPAGRDIYASPAKRSMRSPMSGPTRANRWSASPSWRDRESPLGRRRTERSPQTDRTELTRKELIEIKEALEKQSIEIEEAMKLSSKLWKGLSAA